MSAPQLFLRFGLMSALHVSFAGRASGASEEPDARTAARAFYAVYMRLHPSGVPTQKQRAQFRSVVSPRLASLLQQAAMAERKYARKTKGEAPPLVEGDLFTSLFEGASSFTVQSCKSRGETATCLVDLGYVDPQNKSPVKWKDRVLLVRDRGNWVVDDIEFLGDWQFMHKGRLQGLLKDVVKESKTD